MGMFDNIKCEAPLPLNKKLAKQFENVDFTQQSFQTKDLDCLLNHYVIDKKGYIRAEITHGKHIKKKKPKGHTGVWLPYDFKVERIELKKIKHTGDVNFYDHIEDSKGDQYWLEFKATFLKGKMIKLVFEKKTLYRTKKQVEQDKADLEKFFQTEENKLSTKIRKFLNKYTFGRYRLFKHFLASSLYNIGTCFHRLQWIIIRFL